MKLVVQIPCLNEEETLPLVLDSIPIEIPGIDEIVVLVVDDGSTDRTVEVARAHGVTEFVHHTRNQGLGRSFHDGVIRALELGADILVNTDGDNQYPQNRIGDLVQPIVQSQADLVIGDRQVHTIEHFSPLKKRLQKFGSGVVNRAAGTKLPDAASGFRAYSRESLILLNTVTRFSYCMETIIQAGNKNLKIASIPVLTNPKTRESRLFKSMPEHMAKSGAAIIRSFMMYKPYVIFAWLTAIFGVIGLVPFVRYAALWAFDNESGHLQSLLAGSLFLLVAFMSLMLGVISDLIRTNRVLIEDNLEHTKRIRFGLSPAELLNPQRTVSASHEWSHL
ncbi:glycosyltransferase family 2 protein [Nocardioides sp. Kera G14]|uniref:glycosyltransferase family 2 protein n=1 Tax=Nocardioides sp. Kera G14 TaxID=2884264 RepID=UPI001D116DE2|nr:glycosyltransferase family 2 protein [Nocardioides sp. Kera G14]UDY22676.1 glycosyltransferase family 2 protein [Nocardioides sp. Kera G14]